MIYDALIRSYEDHIAKLESHVDLPAIVEPERYPLIAEMWAAAQMQRKEVERLRELQAKILKRQAA